jgi:hypothetical protein
MIGFLARHLLVAALAAQYGSPKEIIMRRRLISRKALDSS